MLLNAVDTCRRPLRIDKKKTFLPVVFSNEDTNYLHSIAWSTPQTNTCSKDNIHAIIELVKRVYMLRKSFEHICDK